jgi:hypothetical protein
LIEILWLEVDGWEEESALGERVLEVVEWLHVFVLADL